MSEREINRVINILKKKNNVHYLKRSIGAILKNISLHNSKPNVYEKMIAKILGFIDLKKFDIFCHNCFISYLYLLIYLQQKHFNLLVCYNNI